MWKRKIDSPSPTTTYYVPATEFIDLREVSVTACLIKADQACDVWIEASYDGTTGAKLEGYEIASTDFSTVNWNSIIFDAPLRYMRLAVRTGATAPSSIEMVVSTR